MPDLHIPTVISPAPLKTFTILPDDTNLAGNFFCRIASGNTSAFALVFLAPADATSDQAITDVRIGRPFDSVYRALPTIATDSISAEAREFAEHEGLLGALDSAIGMVREHFEVIGTMSVSLEYDPDLLDSPSLVIEAPVAGDPIEVSRAHWLFAVEVAKLLGSQSGRINLVCDIR